MNNERDRLEDLNIEEAVGRSTPPDLTDRILAAADKRELDEAVTPISGRHAVPRTHRPTGRRMTGAVAKKNWQGAGIVTAFALLFTIGLVAFVLLKDPNSTPQQDTAETPKANEPTKTEQPTNQSPPRERWSPADNDEQPEEFGPNEPEPTNEPEPEPKKPDDIVEQPAPEPEPTEPLEEPKPEPKDTVEEPQPEPEQPKEPVESEPKPEQPKDTVEEPKDEGKTVVKPEAERVAVASFSTKDYWPDMTAFRMDRQVRMSSDDKWQDVKANGHPGVELDYDLDVFWLYDGVQFKCSMIDIALTNGAQVVIDGAVGVHTDSEGLKVELVENDIYVDNRRASSRVLITRGEFEVAITDGAALLESTNSRLEIFCTEGELRAGETTILAGHIATWSSRGLSKPRKASANDWRNPFFGAAPDRLLRVEDFDNKPAGGMISGVLESRSEEELESRRDGRVAVDSGRNATVAFQFDGEHETLRGEKVRVRYRASGASKLILQMFCPARNDNFGKDITPGKSGEWHVLEISLKDLRDRETHKDAPPPGTKLSSFSLILTGQDDAQLEVDWVELVREAKFED